ncbi:MAG: recombinase zinc beta ribbon domain-containing protein [Clostridia bacterium]|nr:recombinase zinc beta ribbon domain-containing protein [Clostridia bacterium]
MRKYKNPYTGRIFCADCGSPMFSTSNPKRPDGYVCGSYHRRGLSSGCTSHHIHRKRLDEEVKEFICQVRDSLKNEISDYSVSGSKKRVEDNKKKIERLEKDAEEYKKRLVDIARAKLEETVADPENKEIINETYKRLENEFRNKLKLAESQMVFLEEDSDKRRQIKKNIESILEIFDKILKKKEFSQEDISLIVEKITVSEDKIVTLYLKNSIRELEAVVSG